MLSGGPMPLSTRSRSIHALQAVLTSDNFFIKYLNGSFRQENAAILGQPFGKSATIISAMFPMGTGRASIPIMDFQLFDDQDTAVREVLHRTHAHILAATATTDFLIHWTVIRHILHPLLSASANIAIIHAGITSCVATVPGGDLRRNS